MGGNILHPVYLSSSASSSIASCCRGSSRLGLRRPSAAMLATGQARYIESRTKSFKLPTSWQDWVFGSCNFSRSLSILSLSPSLSRSFSPSLYLTLPSFAKFLNILNYKTFFRLIRWLKYLERRNIKKNEYGMINMKLFFLVCMFFLFCFF